MKVPPFLQVLLGVVLSFSLVNQSMSPICTGLQFILGLLMTATSEGLEDWAERLKIITEAKKKEELGQKSADLVQVKN